jgi:hypothetical protein
VQDRIAYDAAAQSKRHQRLRPSDTPQPRRCGRPRRADKVGAAP